MGTRHLIAVVSNGKYKIAQYGQWDGYPSGQGATICNFIQNEMIVGKFSKAVNECGYLTPEEIANKWELCGADPKNTFVNIGIAKHFDNKFPQLSRETGANILKLVQHGVRELQDSIGFVRDSLFCEWAYVLNLDNETLEVYKGLNREPLNPSERFFEMLSSDSSRDKYFPVKLAAIYSFKEATESAMTKLDKEISAAEDEAADEEAANNKDV